MRGLLLVALLAGCASEGRPLRDWTLDADGGPRGQAIRVPATLFDKLPLRATPFTLVAHVALRPEELGRPLTLVFDSCYGLRGVAIDGWRARDTGDAAVSEHRFVIPAAQTDHPILVVVATVQEGFRDLAFGLPAAPRLLIGAQPDHGPFAARHRTSGIAALALCMIFAVLFATRFLLDRRRRADIAFAIQALAAFECVSYVSFDVGWAPLTAACLAIAALAAAYFIHFEFDRGAPPAWLPIGYGALTVMAIGSAWSFSLLGISFLASGFLGCAWGAHLMRVLVLSARSPARRIDALILLMPMTGAFVLLIGPIVIGLVGLVPPVDAAVLENLTIALWAFAQALVVARQDVAKQRALEATAEQLRRDVAERSKQLADALARLAQTKVEPLTKGGTVEGKYRIVRALGAGGMGTVHEVERITDGRRMALKTLRGRVDTEAMARFAREAQLAAELFHPNLVPVHDVGVTSAGTLFLVMELVDGGSLEAARKRFGDPEWALPILAQIAGGLEAMHSRGIVHRDLKPANVLLQRDVPRIADFGLAVLRSDDPVADIAVAATLAAPDSPPLTRAGAIIGTPFYMAPELAAGAREARAAADVFAFGVMAYEMVCGRPPFPEPPLLTTLAGKPITPAPPLRVDGLDASYAALIDRCLAADPAARPSAADLRELG